MALSEVPAVTVSPPVVYVGPSLREDDVRRYLPGCQPMPPVRRGDLYRDRLLGFNVFVILDGVFAQELAISPRETIDVARDGGLVVGASSMGAMRAAECWPVGVQGVGSVYRLFRRGSLTSDADVAVAFSPDHPFEPMSVPLINVRYALSRCVRDRSVSRSVADRLLRAATGIFFSDRTWDLLFRAADVTDADGSLRAALQQHDLKRMDAIRALTVVQRRITSSPTLLDDDGARRGRQFQSLQPREELHEVTGNDISIEDLWRWLAATGRYRRFPSALQASKPLPPARAALTEPKMNARDLKDATHRSRTSMRMARLLTRPDASLARAIMADMAVAGERDPLVFTLTAITRAVEWAQRRGLGSQPLHRHQVMAETARAHGFTDWDELRESLSGSALWPWIEHSVEQGALARRVRQELFAGSGQSGAALEDRAIQDCI